MKAKLIKKDDGYNLAIEQPQGRLLEATCSPSQQLILDKSGASTKHKLSKQNCDSLFGVIDVEKLADDYFKSTNENSVLWRRIDFKEGFKKAMALNKDKMFTLEDVEEAFAYGQLNQVHNQKYFSGSKTYIQSLQQPTEIDVEIESKIAIDGHTIFGYELDSEGCLILKKI